MVEYEDIKRLVQQDMCVDEMRARTKRDANNANELIDYFLKHGLTLRDLALGGYKELAERVMTTLEDTREYKGAEKVAEIATIIQQLSMVKGLFKAELFDRIVTTSPQLYEELFEKGQEETKKRFNNID